MLSVFDDNVKKYGQEINEDQLKDAESNLKNFCGVCGDTLVNPAFMDRKFDYIIANYPFSIKWHPTMDCRFEDCGVLAPQSKADYAFILHCLYLLSEKGKAVIMGFPGILYRGQAELKIRKWLVDNNYIEQVVHIAGKKFVDTQIATCLLILSKNKTNTDIKFIDSEHNLEKFVKIEEISSNDYNLSVSSYIQYEEPKPPFDPLKTQIRARKAMLNKLRKDIQVDKMVCQFEGWDIIPFLDDLQKVIEEARNEKE